MENTIDSLHVICNSCLPIYCNAEKIQEVGSIKGTSPCHKSCQKWFPMTRLNLMCLKRQSMDTPNHWRTHLNPFLSIFHSHHRRHPPPEDFPPLRIYKAISLKQLFWKLRSLLKPTPPGWIEEHTLAKSTRWYFPSSPKTAHRESIWDFLCK